MTDTKKSRTAAEIKGAMPAKPDGGPVVISGATAERAAKLLGGENAEIRAAADKAVSGDPL